MKDTKLSPLAEGIMAGLQEALADAKGHSLEGTKKSIVYRLSPKAVRQKLSMSQAQFASSFGIPLATLQNWEQGRREMDATAESYLRTISMFPDAAMKAQQI